MNIQDYIFKGQYQIPNDMFEYHRMTLGDVETIIKQQIIHQLAEKIYDIHKESISEEQKQDCIQFNIELLVVNKEQFRLLKKSIDS